MKQPPEATPPWEREAELDPKIRGTIRGMAREYSHLEYPEIAALSKGKFGTLQQVYSISKGLKKKRNREAKTLGDKLEGVIMASTQRQKTPPPTGAEPSRKRATPGPLREEPTGKARSPWDLPVHIVATVLVSGDNQIFLLEASGRTDALDRPVTSGAWLYGPLDPLKDLRAQLDRSSLQRAPVVGGSDVEAQVQVITAVSNLGSKKREMVYLGDLEKNWPAASAALLAGDMAAFSKVCPDMKALVSPSAKPFYWDSKWDSSNPLRPYTHTLPPSILPAAALTSRWDTDKPLKRFDYTAPPSSPLQRAIDWLASILPFGKRKGGDVPPP